MVSQVDTFNRANGALGANWADISSFTIVSNAANIATQSAYGFARYVAAQMATDNHQTELTLGSYTSGTLGSAFVRMDAGGTNAMYVEWTNGTWTLNSQIGGTVVARATGTGAAAATDIITMRAVGNRYTAYRNNGVTPICAFFDANGAVYGAQVNSTHRFTGMDMSAAGAANQSYDNYKIDDVDDTAETRPYIVAATSAAIATSRTAAVTFSGWTPALNDLVVFFPSSTTVGGVLTAPATWVNALTAGLTGYNATTGVIESSAHSMGCVYHFVTAAEVSAVTLTYTATNLYGTTQLGNVAAVVVRNVDTTTPIDSVAGGFNNTTSVTHTIPALTGTNLSTDSLVVGALAKDGTGVYTDPVSWMPCTTNNTNQGKWVGARNALTTAGTNVTATNSTTTIDEAVSISVALSKAVAVTPSVEPLVLMQNWAALQRANLY